MARKSNFDRDEKLLAAMHLFWQKGYANTAISDLVDTLKINRFSLYNTYGDKQKLYYEAIDKYLESVSLPPINALNQPTASMPELELFLKNFAHLQRLNSCGCFMQNAVIEHAGEDDYVLQKSKELFDGLLVVITNALKNAQNEQQLPHFLPVKHIAHLILVQMQGMRVMGKAQRHEDLESALDALLVLLRGNTAC